MEGGWYEALDTTQERRMSNADLEFVGDILKTKQDKLFCSSS